MRPAAILIAAILAQAQTQFEVASVKPNNSGENNWSFNFGDGRLNAVNTSLRDYIRWAYSVKEFQIRAPKWLESARYDIAAKAATAEGGDDAVLTMLQALLTRRFKISLHHETKTLPVYRLVIAKGGPKLRPSDAAQGNWNFHASEISGQGMGMDALAETLTRILDRPVIDRTGLKKRFDLDVKFADPNQPDSPLPSIFTAVQEQLGLKLESAKGPVDVLVIDHAEEPDAN